MSRVLVLTNLYPPHALGGYEAACRDTVVRFRERGHEVRVLTSTWRAPGAADDPDDLEVHRELQLTSTFVTPPALARRPLVERANVALLHRHLGEFRPDVVSVWNMTGLSLTLLPALLDEGAPTVFVVCDDWPVGCEGRDAWMAPFFSRPRLGAAAARATGLPTRLPDLGRAGHFVFASEWLRRRCEHDSGWTFPAAEVVHLGVDLRDFPLIDGDPPVPFLGRVLYVGRLDPSKGVHTLVRALRLLPVSMSLDVVGPGDTAQRQALDALIADLGLGDRVRFATVPRRELSARYRAADVVVFPSEWEEPFGIVPLEAMASGVPVVATGTGGSGEFLRDEDNCLLFPPGDADALAAAVTRLADDDELRRRLTAGGRRTAATITVDAMAVGLEGAHQRGATAGGSGSAPTPAP